MVKRSTEFEWNCCHADHDLVFTGSMVQQFNGLTINDVVYVVWAAFRDIWLEFFFHPRHGRKLCGKCCQMVETRGTLSMALKSRSDGCYSLAVPRVADQRSGVDFSLTEDVPRK